MKSLKHMVVFLAMMMFGYRIQSEEIFTVDCITRDLAFLYTNDSANAVSLPATCYKLHSKNNYTLGPTCLGDTNVIVVSPRVISRFHLTGGRDTRVFTVTCKEKLDGSGTRMTTSTVVQINSTATHDIYHLPVPGVKMFLTAVNPGSTKTGIPPLPGDAEVNLGDQLYLVIASSRQPLGYYEFFLPEQCKAISSPPLNLTLDIWNNTSVDRKCIEQPSLMDRFTVYKDGKRLNNQVYNLAYAPVYAFHFQQMYVHGNMITYTCTFLVCPRSSIPMEHCEQELKHLSSDSTQCIDLDTTLVRRVRGVSLPSPGTTETKTLSTTVRIRPFSYGQSQKGSTSGTIVTVAAGMLVPVVVISVVFIVIIFLCHRRRKKKKEKQPVHQDQIEMTHRRF